MKEKKRTAMTRTTRRMTKTTEPCAFQPSDESGLYLSLIKPAWQSTVINKALGRYLSEQAMIDITDGKGVVSFWRKLDFHKKAEVVRRLANTGRPSRRETGGKSRS